MWQPLPLDSMGSAATPSKRGFLWRMRDIGSHLAHGALQVAPKPGVLVRTDNSDCDSHLLVNIEPSSNVMPEVTAAGTQRLKAQAVESAMQFTTLNSTNNSQLSSVASDTSLGSGASNEPAASGFDSRDDEPTSPAGSPAGSTTSTAAPAAAQATSAVDLITATHMVAANNPTPTFQAVQDPTLLAMGAHTGAISAHFQHMPAADMLQSAAVIMQGVNAGAMGAATARHQPRLADLEVDNAPVYRKFACALQSAAPAEARANQLEMDKQQLQQQVFMLQGQNQQLQQQVYRLQGQNQQLLHQQQVLVQEAAAEAQAHEKTLQLVSKLRQLPDLSPAEAQEEADKLANMPLPQGNPDSLSTKHATQAVIRVQDVAAAIARLHVIAEKIHDDVCEKLSGKVAVAEGDLKAAATYLLQLIGLSGMDTFTAAVWQQDFSQQQLPETVSQGGLLALQLAQQLATAIVNSKVAADNATEFAWICANGIHQQLPAVKYVCVIDAIAEIDVNNAPMCQLGAVPGGDSTLLLAINSPQDRARYVSRVQEQPQVVRRRSLPQPVSQQQEIVFGTLDPRQFDTEDWAQQQQVPPTTNVTLDRSRRGNATSALVMAPAGPGTSTVFGSLPAEFYLDACFRQWYVQQQQVVVVPLTRPVCTLSAYLQKLASFRPVHLPAADEAPPLEDA